MSNSKRSASIFYNAFLYSTDAIILTDTNGIITDINKAFSKLFGWEPKEVIGKSTKILRSSGTTDAFYKQMWQSINEHGKWKGEIINKHKNGTLIPVLLSITPIIENNKIIGYMGIDIDMTESKKLQEQMARSERFATIGQMAAKVAHEIRNPLSSISLNAELLGDEIKSPDFDREEGQSLLKSIMVEVDRLANLTNEYLQFSRMPATISNKYDLKKVITSIRSFVVNELKTKKIDLLLNLPQNPVILYIDKDKIRQVLLNLIKNSIESLNQNGEISISINQNQIETHILVSDNGPGIEKEDQRKIFEPFYTTKEVGTGLGLAICKQLVEDQNGSIHYLDDKPGAHFLIILPNNLN
jgi:PAS domain S-box-containing protein